MNNTVTVNFAANNAATSTTGEPYTFSKGSEGNITLHAESNTERWAILLPQGEVTTAYAHSGDYDYIGTCGTVPTISANNYLSSGIAVVLNPSYVDLGLSSGTKWATCNVGAFEPEDYGDYYAWGATETWYSSLSPLVWKTGKEGGYATANAPYYSNSGWTKYNINSTLEAMDDAAYANWGSNWHIPTAEQWQELMDSCTFTWTQKNGVNGVLITRTGYSGEIFLPAAGIFGTSLGNNGVTGFYFTASQGNYANDSQYVLYYQFPADNSNNGNVYDTGRYFGMSIRAVRAQ